MSRIVIAPRCPQDNTAVTAESFTDLSALNIDLRTRPGKPACAPQRTEITNPTAGALVFQALKEPVAGEAVQPFVMTVPAGATRSCQVPLATLLSASDALLTAEVYWLSAILAVNPITPA